MKVGIGITTRNRNTVLSKNLLYFHKYTPDDFKFVIVDDASSTPVSNYTYRFETRQGISKAKNKCLDLLVDCDHVFLFDDDCYPISDEWWKPYIECREPHLMYIFNSFSNGKKLTDSKIIYYDDQIIAYSYPRGCMLYFDMKELGEYVRMNEDFKIWGWEHVNLSDKIFNNNFTICRYMDVRGSSNLIHSMDENLEIKSSVLPNEKMVNFEVNKTLYNKLKYEK